MKLPKLEELTIPSYFELHGNKLFFIEDNCLHSIELPFSIKKVNNKEIQSLHTYQIPENVTKLEDYCFANYQELEEIIGLEKIKEIGKGCFINCPQLDRNKYPIVKRNIEEYLIQNITNQKISTLESFTELKFTDILFDSKYDDWSFKTSVFDKRIVGKKQLIFLIEDENGEMFGYYCNTEMEYPNGTSREPVDMKSFKFNLQSNNNRLNKPMKFEIIENCWGVGYVLDTSEKGFLIKMGDINIYKKGNEQYSFISKSYNKNFNYHGIENALCGKQPDKYGNAYFTPKRILVIQMK